jgi:HlyD family secretion protein
MPSSRLGRVASSTGSPMTKDERDKLMFRIRVRIDPERLRGRAEIVRSGLPGVVHVRIDPSVDWPLKLQASAPP